MKFYYEKIHFPELHHHFALLASGATQMERKHTFSTPDMLNANITWNISNATVNLGFNTLYRETVEACLLRHECDCER